MFKIEKGVPLPGRGRPESLAGTLRAMQVGDSIVITEKHQTYVYAAAKAAGVKIASQRDGAVARVWVVSKAAT